ncbi:MAG: hypothetical protein AB7K08_11665 [Microbacteriaceae bacterium]
MNRLTLSDFARLAESANAVRASRAPRPSASMVASLAARASEPFSSASTLSQHERDELSIYAYGALRAAAATKRAAQLRALGQRVAAMRRQSAPTFVYRPAQTPTRKATP